MPFLNACCVHLRSCDPDFLFPCALQTGEHLLCTIELVQQLSYPARLHQMAVRADTSKRLGALLLKGWAMLAENCPDCQARRA